MDIPQFQSTQPSQPEISGNSSGGQSPETVQESKKEAESSDRTSPVWKYFDLLHEGDKTFTQCKVLKNSLPQSLCGEKLRFHNSTSSLYKHLGAYHTDTYNLCQSLKREKSPAKQTTLSGTFKSLSKERSNAISIAIACFISFDMRRLPLIEGEGFQQFMKILEPNYELPCRQTFAETNLYKSVRSHVLSQISQATSFGLTYDYWESVACKSFLTLTLYFCSKDFALHNYVLRTVEVFDSHTGENTAKAIQKILSEYDLDKKENVQFYTISDSAANMKAAAEILKYAHFPCFCHILHNSLHHAFQAPEVKKIVEKARELMKYFRSSPARSNKLIQMQTQLKLPVTKLKLDCDTRWNSLYDSIDRLVKNLQPIVNIGLQETEVAEITLTLQEWQDLIEIRNTLAPFQEITKILSSENTSSISMLKPLIWMIQTDFLRIRGSDGDLSRTLKHLIYEDFIERIQVYNNLEDILLLASLLDPRFKALQFLDESDKSKAEKLLKEKFEKYQDLVTLQQSPDDQEIVMGTKRVKVNTEALMRIFKFPSSDVEQNDDHFKEVRAYLQVDQISLAEDPLSWWADNSSRFKTISLIAKDVLCLPSTSVPSECLFSKAGNIISNKRASFGSKLADTLIFLAENKSG